MSAVEGPPPGGSTAVRRGIGAVFTDLDATLLESDGTLGAAARHALSRLRALGVPVLPMTSKTQGELERWLVEIDAGGMGSFENGAGIVGPLGVEVAPSAVPLAALADSLREMARHEGLALRALPDLPDAELHDRTGLDAPARARARERAFDLPFLAPPGVAEERLRRAAERCRLTLVKGGLFWHLSGAHDKADAFRRLRERYRLPGPVAALGDAANDAGFLALADLPVIVPGRGGPDPRLIAALPPGTPVAPSPYGAGWAAAVERLLEA